MLAGVKEQVSPTAVDIDEASATVPVKLLTGARVSRAVPCTPATTETEVEEDWRVKLGTAATTVIMIVCDSEPLAPVTFTRKDPATAVLTVRTEEPVPPFTRVTVEELREPVTLVGSWRVSVTVPANDTRLDRLIVDIPFVLTATETVEGDAERVKSFGGTVTRTSIVWVSEPLTPVTFTL